MIVIGERLNTSRAEVNAAVGARDVSFVREEVRAQMAAGADLVEVNAGSRRSTEVDDLGWFIDVVRDADPDVRLCVDSSNPETLEAVIARAGDRPLLNSVTGERARLDATLPLLGEWDCDVVALCVDDRGIPRETSRSVEIAWDLVEALEAAGVARERIFLDFALTAVSTDQSAAARALEVFRQASHALPEVGTVCGLSNVSFGLPVRSLLNRTFLAMAMETGLTAAICDPLDGDLMSTILAGELLLGRDRRCQRYSRAYREGRLASMATTNDEGQGEKE